MKRKYRDWLKWCLVGVAIWIGANLIILSMCVWQMKAMVEMAQAMQLNELGQRGQSVERLLGVYRFASLGGYRWGSAENIHDLMQESADLSQLAVSLSDEVTKLGGETLAGLVNDEAEWRFVFRKLKQMNERLGRIEKILDDSGVEKMSRLAGVNINSEQIRKAKARLDEVGRLEDEWIGILGYGERQHVIVLLQNNAEIRPTGGFMGSYAEFWLESGAVKDLKIEDIYIPDGQIKGYVEPPLALTLYLRDGDRPGWRLRDSNWHPDFPTAVDTIEWFFVEGGLEPIDAMIALTMPPIVDLVEVIGPIDMPDYGVQVTHENFYEITQREVQADFFPGSYQKTQYMSKLGKAILQKLQTGEVDWNKYAGKLGAQLARRNVLIYTRDEGLARFLADNKWDGSIVDPQCGDECTEDYLYLVDANVGSTKANCCLERSVQHEIYRQEDHISHTLTQKIVNHNPVVPEPPNIWGGGYKNYQRIMLSEEAILKEIVVDGKKLDEEEILREDIEGKQMLGYMQLIEGTQTGTVKISYQVPVNNKVAYKLYIQKQPGVERYPHVIKWPDEVVEMPLDSDIELIKVIR